ncbi:MAG: PQQ-binding-like beta-propeller repeat protein [Deltaproteobacteria bacterium]|nr:PQQ-binding-like beta-propeller repeat protein [Deltaproteobacteria bacterium]
MAYREVDSSAAALIVAFNGAVFRLDPETGAELWCQHVGGGSRPMRLLISGERGYVATSEAIWCLDVRSGDIHWSAQRTCVGDGPLVRVGGRLLVAADGVLECFSETGEPLWVNSFDGYGYGPVALGVPGAPSEAGTGG